jgi:uncharacterized protein YciI
MTEGRRHFFLKLIPCRPTFALDMTDEERAIMQRHVVYWRGLMDEGRVVVFGPVMDPGGPYGMGVIEAADEDEVENFIERDPASKINKYEWHPMRAVLPAGVVK